MTYYFINDFNDICRQKDGMDKDFAEVIDLIDLIDDINRLGEENHELRKGLYRLKSYCVNKIPLANLTEEYIELIIKGEEQ